MEPQEQPDQTASGRGVPITRTLLCVGVFYGIMVALNGVAMHQSASLAEFGWRRDALRRLNRPLEVMSRATGAYRFRAAVSATAGQWLNRKAGT